MVQLIPSQKTIFPCHQPPFEGHKKLKMLSRLWTNDRPGFDKALAVMRKHTSLSLGMATFTVQLPNFRACRPGRCKHPQMVSNTPLFVNKKLQRSINRHKTWKSEEMLLFPLSLEKSYLSMPQLSGFLLHGTIIYQFTYQVFNTFQSLLIK